MTVIIILREAFLKDNNIRAIKRWNWRVLCHSRMRGQSSGLVTAADKIPAIGVLFAVDYDVIVRKPCFQRGTTHVFLKNFRSFLFKFFGQRHGVLILLQPIRIGPCSGGRSIFRSISGFFIVCFEGALYTHAYEIFGSKRLRLPLTRAHLQQGTLAFKTCMYRTPNDPHKGGNTCLQNIYISHAKQPPF